MWVIIQILLRFWTIFLIPLFNIFKNFAVKFIVWLWKNAFSFKNIFWTFLWFFPFIFKKFFIVLTLTWVNNMLLKKVFSILIIYTFISFFVWFFINPISFVFYHLHISLNYLFSYFILYSTSLYIYSILLKFFFLSILWYILFSLYYNKG